LRTRRQVRRARRPARAPARADRIDRTRDPSARGIVRTVTDGQLLIRSRAELDMLLLNFEAAVRVRHRSDFFSWMQGVFQALIQHEVLVCALDDPGARTYRIDWISSIPLDEAHFAALSEQGRGLIHQTIGLWEKTGHRPMLLQRREARSDATPTLVGELRRLQLDNAIAHGVPGLDARACGFFFFARIGGGIGPQHLPAVELAVPYLHAAWLRACCAGGKRAAQASAVSTREILTAREIEILSWVEQGKSNGEIGQILGISPLTVKNHVQKILRKLNVQNRAQAVARAINLNLARSRLG
jgi:transcriptional regulator EpsA